MLVVQTRRTTLAFAALLFLHGSALAADPAPSHAPIAVRGSVQDKNFLVFSLIEADRDAAAALAADSALSALAASKKAALQRASTACAQDVACLIEPMRLSGEEIAAVAAALERIYRTDARVRALDPVMRSSGAYVRYHDRSGEQLLAQAWVDAARGINNIIDVYGAGTPPRSPDIDGVSYDVKGEAYGRVVQTSAAVLAEELRDSTLFFQPSARFALRLLDANHRDEAARQEPLHQGENADALRRIPSIAWSDFRYSAIIVPGSGPDRLMWSLSTMSHLRLELAARRFKEGKAPLIVVSGGYVYPKHTPYCEAIEMKKALVSDFGIPAEAILVEPHARHTTTNLRNVARLLYRYAVPFDRKALVTTDPSHSSYIGGEAFATRCSTELGYQPVSVTGRVSAFDLEVVPRVDSLQIDPTDPLDP